MGKELDLNGSEPAQSRRIEKYLLLQEEYYRMDMGRMIYASTFIIEGPYALWNTLKDAYYHLKGVDHTHC